MTQIDESIRERALARLRPPPTEDPRFVIRPFGDDHAQPIRFYLYKDVVDELVFSSGYEDDSICVSILLGGFGVDDDEGFVEISGFTGTNWVSEPEEMYEAIKPTADAWLRAGEDDPMVGLFVARAGSEGHVDEEMARVHYSLFNIPFQPLVVYDPADRVLSVNARAPRSSFFNAAFRAVGRASSDGPSLNAEASDAKSVSSGMDAEE